MTHENQGPARREERGESSRKVPEGPEGSPERGGAHPRAICPGVAEGRAAMMTIPKAANDNAQGWRILGCDASRQGAIAKRLGALAGVSVCNPVEVRLQRCGYRRREVPHALFPSYLFVRFDVATGIWERMRLVAGVRRFVTMAGNPVLLPERAIEKIVALQDWVANDPRCLVAAKRAFQAGEAVRVRTGPLAGLVGTVDEWLVDVVRVDSVDRIKVVIDAFGRKTPVELEASEIEPV